MKSKFFLLLAFLLSVFAGTDARSQTFTTIHTLSSDEGSHINGRLIQGSDGNFYGTAQQGGSVNYGTVFKVTSDGTLTVLYSFGTTAGDGGFPWAGLTKGNDGNFYGTSDSTIFKITPTGTLTTLYTLGTQATDGSGPKADLVLGSDGNFYGTTGTTFQAGSAAYGTVFKVTTNGTAAGTTFTTIHSFSAAPNGTNADGAGPADRGGLVEGSDGNFYGVTIFGGSFAKGVIFKITPAGALTNLYDIGTNASDGGGGPDGALVAASPGLFYGTMTSGGLAFGGTAFQMTTNGTRAGTVVTNLYSFQNSTDGGAPAAPMVVDSDDNIYGMTSLGGANYQNNSFDQGVLFRISSDQTYSVLHSFGVGDGQPHPGVILAKDGNLYGTTTGTVFKFTLPPNTPVPPVHGGLSSTVFKVNGSKGPSANVADTVLRFSAQQTGTPADLIVRVQASTDNRQSWVNLNNGSGVGYMTLDKTTNQFVLNSTNYPLQSTVFFRAQAQAPGYDDSNSDPVGPFDLTPGQNHLGPTTLYLATNGNGAAMNFRVTEISPPAGIGLRIQATATPHEEASWTDLGTSDNNTGFATMFPYSDPTQFYLNTTHYPSGDFVYFRAVATAPGYVKSLSNAIGVIGVVAGDPPIVDVLIPLPATGGPGLDADHPLIVSLGTLNFGAQASTSNARQIKTIGVLYDGAVLEHAENGATIVRTQYGTNVAGDHIIKAFARDDLGIMGYADPIYIRMAPAGGKVFTMGTSGAWSNALNWTDAQGNNGIPGVNDFAIVGSFNVSITQDVTAYAITLNGGSISGAGGGLTVTGYFSIAGGQLKNLDATVGESATLAVVSDTDVPMSGSLTNYGTFKLAGRGGIVPVPSSSNVTATESLRMPETPDGFFDGLLTAIKNFGNWVFHHPAERPAPPQPPPATPPPVALPRVVIASSFENHGKLLTSDGAGIVSNDGGSVVGTAGGSLLNEGGNRLIGQDGAGLITSDGAGVIAQGGGNVISDHGVGFISDNGAAIITPVSAAGTSSSNVNAAAASTGFIQTSGETDLTGIYLIAPVSLQGGVLSGTGVIYGNVTNSGGFISPGHSAGSISISGDYTQSAQGALIIENGGPAPKQYDQLQVTGTATLGGKLDVRTINGYTPSTLDTFSPLGYKTVSGSFSSVSSNAQLSFGSGGAIATVNPNVPQPSSGQPLNIATRMKVLGGDNVLIAGFIVTGPGGSTKKVLIRGIGPSLANFGVSGTLSDPLLELYKPDGSVVTNDNWQQGDTSQIPSGFAPGDPRESVVVATLTPGNYTAIVKGAHGETGIGLAEVYDLDSSSTAKLANIATRGFIDTGDNVMIGGFIVGGNEPATILVRAIGPTLTTFGVQGALDDPMLELHDANGGSINNDNWRETQENDIVATTIPPSNNREPAILATLVPGNYTAIVRGKNNTTGIGLVEAYNLQ